MSDDYSRYAALMDLPELEDSVWINGDEHRIERTDWDENELTIDLTDPITVRTEEGETVLELEEIVFTVHIE